MPAHLRVVREYYPPACFGPYRLFLIIRASHDGLTLSCTCAMLATDVAGEVGDLRYLRWGLYSVLTPDVTMRGGLIAGTWEIA